MENITGHRFHAVPDPWSAKSEIKMKFTEKKGKYDKIFLKTF